MKIPYLAVGVFVVIALLLTTVGLFLIGDHNKAFSHHVDFYTELTDVNGIVTGSKVRVSGFDAGQVTEVQIPGSPAGRFRIKLHLDAKLRSLIRDNSQVTVESDGLVGDKFLQIHEGSNNSREAAAGATLSSKEPVELTDIVNKMTGIMDQAKDTVGDLRGRLDSTLDALHTTVDSTDGLVTNADGMVSDVRHGKGTVGMLLSDQQTANQVKGVIANTQMATANLNQVSLQARQVVDDFQKRDLPQKAEDTLSNAKDASQQLDQTSKQVNTALTEALGPDISGKDAGANIRETLSNVNLATSNLTDDTEALKHNFFFRGFFKKRGFYSLAEMTPDEYRKNRYFDNPKNQRAWLGAADAFARDASGNEILSETGAMQIDEIIGAEKGSVVNRPIVVEGYSSSGSAADEMVMSRNRTLLVAHYLEKRFHLSARNIGLMPMSDEPPVATGKRSWDGASLVLPVEVK